MGSSATARSNVSGLAGPGETSFRVHSTQVFLGSRSLQEVEMDSVNVDLKPIDQFDSAGTSPRRRAKVRRFPRPT
jgi:hypothetical protein